MAIKDTTLYIGRFNPFHLGHAHVLERALKTSKKVIVLVGSTGQPRSLKNPFSYTERYNMISWWAEGIEHNAELIIRALPDHPYNDALWISSVQEAVKHFSPDNTVHLTGSDRDDSTWYLKSFPQWELDLVPEHSREDALSKMCATSVREILYTNQSTTSGTLLKFKVPASSADFLLKFMNTEAGKKLRSEYEFISDYKKSWSSAPYEPIFVTTDAVVVQSGHVLVIQRGAYPGKGLWALPGGFINPKETLQDCVIRELIEETGIRLTDGKKSAEITAQFLKGAIKDREIFDKPDRSSRGRTITTAFLIQLDDTKPLPKVKGMNAPSSETSGKKVLETRNTFWLPINEALHRTDMWFEDHHGILSHFVSKLNSRY
jgi:bifunctional NMN adenylyltransferase/nudix hydrolase